MQCVKLTLFVEEGSDLDMEVHVVNAEQAMPATQAVPSPVIAMRPRAVASPGIDDEYALGGYAGI